MRDARDEVCEAAEVVHSERMVVLWAMHELWFGVLLVSHELKPSPGRRYEGMEGAEVLTRGVASRESMRKPL